MAKALLTASLASLLFCACNDTRTVGTHPNGAPSASAETPAAATAPAASGAAPTSVDPAQLAAVAQQVTANNAAEKPQGSDFEAAGWTLVDVTDGPDVAITSFDPATIDSAPEALRVQLASTNAGEGDVDHIAAIATNASDSTLRIAAIDALGRIDGNRAQGALLSLVGDATLDADSKLAAAARLRPSDLDDAVAQAMAQLLDNVTLDDATKNQVAFNLALTAARDGMQLPTSTLNALSPTAQTTLAAMATLIAGQETP